MSAEPGRLGRPRRGAGATDEGAFVVDVTWVDGPRNAAWDELWRRMLADVLGARRPAAPPTETRPHREDDGRE